MTDPHPEIIGRRSQIAMLDRAMASARPEFVAVYGRRRVGKTFLVKEYFHAQFDFYMTGAYNATRPQLLEYFHGQLEEYSGMTWRRPRSWLEAFRQLKIYLTDLAKRKRKIVVFIDELPWFDTPRSGFLVALELFWNGWADSQTGLKFVVCGSATTWMTSRLITGKGGLHNRVTRRIYLPPFSLGETEQLLTRMGAHWTRRQIIEGYMSLGGTPFYWGKIDPSQSLTQNIDRLFFQPEGELREEYDILYRSLFSNSTLHQRIVELLAHNARGMTRSAICQRLGLTDSGHLTAALQNLVSCDFLRPYRLFDNTRGETMYQLCDMFTLFYLRYVKANRYQGAGYWNTRIDSPEWRAWSGYAFEQVCMHHIDQIKAALGITSIPTAISAWAVRADEQSPGAQIDLVIDRRDDVVNLCEIKYYRGEYDLTAEYLASMQARLETFRRRTGTRKALHLTMINLWGLKDNALAARVPNALSADDLFT